MDAKNVFEWKIQFAGGNTSNRIVNEWVSESEQLTLTVGFNRICVVQYEFKRNLVWKRESSISWLASTTGWVNSECIIRSKSNSNIFLESLASSSNNFVCVWLIDSPIFIHFEDIHGTRSAASELLPRALSKSGELCASYEWIRMQIILIIIFPAAS